MQIEPPLSEEKVRHYVTVMGFFFIIAAIGGVLRGLHRRMSWPEILVGGGASGLVGMIAGVILLELWGPQQWAYVLGAVSVLSWIGGTVVLDFFADAAHTAAKSRWRILMAIVFGKKLPAGFDQLEPVAAPAPATTTPPKETTQ